MDLSVRFMVRDVFWKEGHIIKRIWRNNHKVGPNLYQCKGLREKSQPDSPGPSVPENCLDPRRFLRHSHLRRKLRDWVLSSSCPMSAPVWRSSVLPPFTTCSSFLHYQHFSLLISRCNRTQEGTPRLSLRFYVRVRRRVSWRWWILI